MPIIKCKMCGGDLRIIEGSTVCECEYCGTRQTVPSADNEKKLTLFARAGRLLRGCEFDKAAGVFETIVADFPEEAEAYWGLVLCKYGIEYVDDPATGKKIPTCHRSSFDSVLDDPNFEQACENTDAIARRVYRDEARQIEDLRKRIIEVSGREEPYDVFISYKETGENGDRTLDSVIAQDIYTELTEKGYRVFFSRISLEDKLGTEYEPYIFAALNSAKVMLVVGTDYENFDAVWVKNEWSRFLKLIASGRKKTLIPVFKNMDAYDMPKEFAKLAAQDMGKVGAMQDLVRGVEKLIGKKGEAVKETVKETVVVQQSGGPNVTALLKRGQQALEDGDWDRAKEYFDRVLDMDAENSDAFFGLFLAGTQCGNENGYIRRACTKEAQTEKLSIQPATERIRKAIKQYAVKDYLSEQDIQNLFQYDLSYSSALKAQQRISNTEKQAVEQDRNFSRATRYARNDEAVARLFKARLFAELDAAVKKAKEREAAAREKKQQNYDAFLDAAEKKAEEKYRQALDRQEADRKKREEARQKELAEQEAARRKKLEKQEAAYQDALRLFEQAKNRTDYHTVKVRFLALASYKDSGEMAKCCDEKVAQIKKAVAEEKERQRLLVVKAEKAKKARAKRIVIAAFSAGILLVASYFTYSNIIVPGNNYKAAVELFESGKYEEAKAAFESLNGFKDSTTRIEEAKTAILERDYAAADAILESGDYDQAIAAFEALNGYRDSNDKITEANEAINTDREAWLEACRTVGSTVTFGSYEQDNDTLNGKEPIEWIVLDVEDDRSLLISKYALDCRPYNKNLTSVTWETCSLREWLNNSFLNRSFSEEEQNRICQVTVRADKNPFFPTDPGNNTMDRVFLLGIQEAYQFFTTEEARKCELTKYAVARGVWIGNTTKDAGSPTCCWWLRSPGDSSDYAVIVDTVGQVDDYKYTLDSDIPIYHGGNVDSKDTAVRPALWIDLAQQTGSNSEKADNVFRMKPSLGVEVTNGSLTGVYLEKVSPDGPAAKTGVKENDLVISFNGKKIETSQDFLNLYQQCSDGDTVELELYPGGKEHTATILLETPKTLGIGVLGTSSEGLGVVVTKVSANSSAAIAGIEEGDMIFEINEYRVLNTRIFDDIMNQYRIGDAVNVTVLRGNEQINMDITLESSDFGILDVMPKIVNAEEGASRLLLSVKAVGQINEKSFAWFGDPEYLGDGLERVVAYRTGDMAPEKGLRVETVFDKETNTYISTMWADGLTSKASGNYYCQVEDSKGRILKSSTVTIDVN